MGVDGPAAAPWDTAIGRGSYFGKSQLLGTFLLLLNVGPGGDIPLRTRKMCFEIMQSRRTRKSPFCFILALVLWPSLWRMLFLSKQELLSLNPKNVLGQISTSDPGGQAEGKDSGLLLRSPQHVGKDQPLPPGPSSLKVGLAPRPPLLGPLPNPCSEFCPPGWGAPPHLGVD